MKVIVKARHMDLTPALKNHAEEKLGEALKRIFDRPAAKIEIELSEPLAPGSVDVDKFGEVITLTSRGEAPLTYQIGPQGWHRERGQTVDGCDLSAREVWQFHETSRSRLSATYESRVELSGDCEFTGLSSCNVRYAVWGVRR